MTKQIVFKYEIFFFADAAKRKQLPAWIREGLEKMEREKRRKMEQEQSFDEPEYSDFKNENVSQEVHNVEIYIFFKSYAKFIKY